MRSRAGADDALIRGICASATRSLRKAIHRWNTHIHSVCIDHACMYLYPCAGGYTDERIADARPAAHTRPRAASMRVCMCDWGPTHPRRNMRARSVGVDRGCLGPQALRSASALSSNIGAWNTARVTTLSEVCAAFCMHYTYTCMSPCVGTAGVCVCVRARARSARANTRYVWRPLFVTPSMQHAHTQCMYTPCMYLHPCAAGYTDERIADAGPPHTRAHVLRPCACACAIGRPRIRAGTCERVPSAWTEVGSARRRSGRRRRSTPTSARGTPRRSPRCPRYAPPFRPGRRATAGGTRSAGRRCGGAADARVCVRRRVSTRMRGCPRV
jgi:hypothetical protein